VSEMNLIMERWGDYLRYDAVMSPVVEGRSAQSVLDLAMATETKLKQATDEVTRKKLLASVFTGVSLLAASVYLAPVLATIMGSLGMKVSVAGLIAKFSKAGVPGFWNALSDDVKEQIVDKLPDYAGKLKGYGSKMIEKLLQMPDTESKKVDFLQALDLPDNLDDMLNDDVYNAVVEKIKIRLQTIAAAGNDLDEPSITLASSLLRKRFGLQVTTPMQLKMPDQQ
jgi:hypothetical protein